MSIQHIPESQTDCNMYRFVPKVSRKQSYHNLLPRESLAWYGTKRARHRVCVWSWRSNERSHFQGPLRRAAWEDERHHLHSAEGETEPEHTLPKIAMEHRSELDLWSAGPSPQAMPKPCCASVADRSPNASSLTQAEMINFFKSKEAYFPVKGKQTNCLLSSFTSSQVHNRLSPIPGYKASTSFHPNNWQRWGYVEVTLPLGWNRNMNTNTHACL